MKILCSIGLHKWSSWGRPFEVTLVVCKAVKQARSCARCDVVEWRSVEPQLKGIGNAL